MQSERKPLCDQDQLLLRAQRGERAAFDALQGELLPSVERFVCRLIGVREEVQDITREALLALWISIRRMDRPEAMLPFAYRVARNKAYDVLRVQGRFNIIDTLTEAGDATVYHVPDAAAGPEETTLRLALWREVQAAMERLPELQRQTLILYAEEDFTYQQIAEAMATDLGTVRSRLFHARRNLLRHLRPDIRETLGLTVEERKHQC
jgi:RNA polymerase sigma-70 factor (ECF subfamily)